MRPDVHERRVVSSGTILEPRSDPATWEPGTQLDILRGSADQQPLPDARRFADGLSSWLLRRTDGTTEWMVFNRPAGSERDLVVLASVFDATIVQRHPAGSVRVVGSFGVLRWDGFSWHHEPPVKSWIDAVTTPLTHGDAAVIEDMLKFAIHDLGSLRIGALLIYRPDGDPGPAVEERLPTPPPLRIRTATHLAPLRHALAQVDGAAVFDADGVLRQLGVRLVPSNRAEADGRATRGHAPHLRPALQPRRPARHRHRRQRRRSRLRVSQRRDPRQLPRRLIVRWVRRSAAAATGYARVSTG